MSRLNGICSKGQFTLAAWVALGLLAAPLAAADGPKYVKTGYGPGYCQPCKPYYYGAPQPGQPTTPPATADGGKTGEDQNLAPEAQPQDNNQPNFTPDNNFSSLSTAGGGAGSATTFLGRADRGNRLNLFDTMSAVPMNRVWFSYMIAPNYRARLFGATAGGGFGSPSTSGAGASQDFSLYRMGGEVLLDQDTSVAFQAQYYTTSGADVAGFTNPQVMLKRVLYRDCHSVLTAIGAVTPQFGNGSGPFGASRLRINETTTRLYAGALYWEDLGNGFFTQGGFQVGMPTGSNQVYTLDWASQLGYWLYRHSSVDPCACCQQQQCCSNCCGCCQPSLLGIAAQFEIFGKHVLNDSTVADPYGAASSSYGTPSLYLEEYRNVIDISYGLQFWLRGNMFVGAGMSLPVSNGRVRNMEYMTNVNYRF